MLLPQSLVDVFCSEIGKSEAWHRGGSISAERGLAAYGLDSCCLVSFLQDGVIVVGDRVVRGLELNVHWHLQDTKQVCRMF